MNPQAALKGSSPIPSDIFTDLYSIALPHDS